MKFFFIISLRKNVSLVPFPNQNVQYSNGSFLSHFFSSLITFSTFPDPLNILDVGLMSLSSNIFIFWNIPFTL